ncbi:MAG: ATP synthase F1 subunit gamma [Candidatus Komeilibacteria bacterium]|nr:ATP synthase F1 subunit gamma [Candidatus Komeilibacteria bacterium]
MPVNTKTIKRRIKSVGSTKKITKAMEMISAVKMRKAVANDLASRTYASLAWQMLSDIAAKTGVAYHPLMASRKEIKSIGLVLITSNRGLAGGFSSRLLQAVHEYIKKTEAEIGAKTEVIVLGRRGQKIYHRFGHQITAEFNKIDLTASAEDIIPLSRMIIKDYINKKYDKIVLAYTDYLSPLKQVPQLKELLPLLRRHEITLPSEGAGKDWQFIFEPNPKETLNVLVPRLVEMQIYQAVLESDASEHSARMMAMRNATDAAEDMISELQHSYNKARQAAITQEIAEIVGGAAALG